MPATTTETLIAHATHIRLACASLLGQLHSDQENCGIAEADFNRLSEHVRMLDRAAAATLEHFSPQDS